MQLKAVNIILSKIYIRGIFMRKKFLFHKTLSIILIVLFITFFTFSSVQAYSSYKYNDYMNIIFQDEQYFDRNTYKNFLNVFNSYTKG